MNILIKKQNIEIIKNKEIVNDLNKNQEQLISQTNNINERNAILIKEIKSNSDKLDFATIDYALNQFSNFQSSVSDTQLLIETLKEKTKNSEKLNSKINSLLSEDDHLMNIRLYNLKALNDSLYKKKIITEFIRLANQLKTQEKYNQNSFTTYYILNQKDFWNYEEISKITKGLLEVLDADFKNIENYLLLSEIVTTINTEFKFELVQKEPNNFIKILQINNTLINEGHNWTLDELSELSPQVFTSNLVILFDTAFCDSMELVNMDLVNRFSNLIKNREDSFDLFYSIDETILDDIYSDDSEEIKTSQQFELVCKMFHQLHHSQKEKVDFWTKNESLEIQKVNPKRLVDAVLNQTL